MIFKNAKRYVQIQPPHSYKMNEYGILECKTGIQATMSQNQDVLNFIILTWRIQMSCVLSLMSKSSNQECKSSRKSPLQKQAYSYILKILPSKNENFQIKILIFFIFSAQNIDCGYSLESPR